MQTESLPKMEFNSQASLISVQWGRSMQGGIIVARELHYPQDSKLNNGTGEQEHAA